MELQAASDTAVCTRTKTNWDAINEAYSAVRATTSRLDGTDTEAHAERIRQANEASRNYLADPHLYAEYYRTWSELQVPREPEESTDVAQAGRGYQQAVLGLFRCLASEIDQVAPPADMASAIAMMTEETKNRVSMFRMPSYIREKNELGAFLLMDMERFSRSEILSAWKNASSGSGRIIMSQQTFIGMAQAEQFPHTDSASMCPD